MALTPMFFNTGIRATCPQPSIKYQLGLGQIVPFIRCSLYTRHSREGGDQQCRTKRGFQNCSCIGTPLYYSEWPPCAITKITTITFCIFFIRITTTTFCILLSESQQLPFVFYYQNHNNCLLYVRAIFNKLTIRQSNKFLIASGQGSL